MRINPSASFTHYAAFASLSCLGLMAVLPFLQPYHALPITSFYSEWLALACGIGACLVFLLPDFWRAPKLPSIAIYLLALIAFVATQILSRPPIYMAQVIYPVLYLAWAVALTWVTVWLREQIGLQKILHVLAWFIFAGGLIQALIGIAQYLETPGWLGWFIVRRPPVNIYGNLGQPNHFAAQITLAAFALIYLHVARQISMSTTAVMLVLFALVLTLSGSRSVILYLFAATAFSWLAYGKSRDETHRRSGSMITAFTAMYLLAQWLMPNINMGIKEIASELGTGIDHFSVQTATSRSLIDGLQDRLMEWHKAWFMFLQSPLWGIGINQYGWYSLSAHALPEFANIARMEAYTHSHNLFFQMLAETGLIGLSLVVAILVNWLIGFLKTWTDTQSWLIATSLLVLLIFSNLEYPLWYSHFLGLAAILLSSTENKTVAIRFTPWLGQTAAAAIMLLAAAILFFTFDGFNYLTRTNKLILERGSVQASQVLESTTRNPLLTPWAEAAMAAHGEPNKRVTEAQLALVERVAKHQPEPANVNRYILYLAMAGRKQDAIELLQLSAKTYAFYYMPFVCTLMEIPDNDLDFLRQASVNLLSKPANCNNLTSPTASAVARRTS